MKYSENNKVNLLDELTGSSKEIDNLIEKYDAESRFRTFVREYNKFCVNSIEKKASLLDWC